MKSMSLYEIHFGFPMRKLLQIFFHPKDITHNGLTPQYTSLETRHELDETSTFIINFILLTFGPSFVHLWFYPYF